MSLLLRSLALCSKSNVTYYRAISPLAFQRFYASQKRNENSLEASRNSSGGSSVSTDVRPIGEKVKEAAKTTSYLGVIILGVGVTGIMFYAIFSELFSSNSPNAVYTDALEKCKEVGFNLNLSVKSSQIIAMYL